MSRYLDISIERKTEKGWRHFFDASYTEGMELINCRALRDIFSDTCIVSYWLKDAGEMLSDFYSVNSDGNIDFNFAGVSVLFVRPCFTVKL